MEQAAFEECVREGVARLPAWVREKIKNVAILIEKEPSADIRRKENLGQNDTLLGLYQGVPLTERGLDAAPILPDTITLYMGPIIEAAKEDRKDVQDVVTETVWHEFAHYFGMDEHAVRAREDAGTNQTESAKRSSDSDNSSPPRRDS